MSAVRMVAYGVLEMKHQEQKPSLWMVEQSPEEQERIIAENYERDQLRKLVGDELRRYGLLLQRSIVPKASAWRTKLNEHTLYGQVQKGGLHDTPHPAPRGFQGVLRHRSEIA